MRQILLLVIFIPFISYSQLENAPLKDGILTYEKIITLENINDKNIVFNAAKSALIRNTNYKYTKIDEDRTSGNITTEIAFNFVVNSALGPWTYNAKSNLSIDVKENRFRIRLYNNSASFTLMQQLITIDLNYIYQDQKEMIEKGKYKIKKDAFNPWNSKLLEIMDAFSFLVKEGVKDDF